MTHDTKPTITTSPEFTPEQTWYDEIRGSLNIEDKENGTDASDSMDDVNMEITVPTRHRAQVSASLGVDDWGKLTITKKSTNDVALQLALTEAEDPPGERGGHSFWEAAGFAELTEGTYTIHVEQQNVTYLSPDYDRRQNVSRCEFVITAKKMPIPYDLTTEYTIRVDAGGDYVLQCKVTLGATYFPGDPVQLGTISDLKVLSASPVRWVYHLKTGEQAILEVSNISARFTSDTLIDVEKGYATRRARVYWHFRRVVEGVLKPDEGDASSELGTMEPVFHVRFDVMKAMLSKMGNGRLGLLGCALALVLAGCQLPQEGSTPVSQEDSQAPLAMAEETVCALRARYGQGMIDKADLLRAELVAAQVRLWETPETDQAAYASACAAILEKLEAVRTWAAGYAKGFGDELPLCRVEAELARFRFCECATLGGDEAALRETFVGAAARYLQLAEAQQTSAGCTNPLVGEARLWFQEALDAAPSLQ